MLKFLTYSSCIVLPVIFIVSQAAAGDNFTWYKDPKIKLSFAYPEKFKPENPAEQSTRVLVNWRTKKSRNIMASCYLKAMPTVGKDAAARQQLKINPDGYIKSNIDFARKMGRTVSLISQRNIKIDDLDGLYFVTKGTSESFDRTITLDLHHIVTFWDAHQIILMCGTSLPYELKGQAPEDQIIKVVAKVEAEIMKVLRTLHFDRN
jgi:hypothetical protein